MRRILAVLAVAVVALTGCTAPPPEPEPTPLAITDAANLIGFWTVDDSFSDEESILRIDNDEIAEWSECGLRTGQWNARGALIALLFTDSDVRCGDSVVASYLSSYSALFSSWRTATNTFNPVDGDTYELVGKKGEVLATLTRGAKPPKREGIDAGLYVTPIAAADATTRFAGLPPLLSNGLPLAIRPGTYTPQGGDTITKITQLDAVPHVRFHENSFVGLDECGDAVHGVWSFEGSSILTLVSNESRSSCESMALYEWLSSAARVGETDPGLVLLDETGELVVKLDLDLEPGYSTVFVD